MSEPTLQAAPAALSGRDGLTTPQAASPWLRRHHLYSI
jgi:hypothetical protein